MRKCVFILLFFLLGGCGYFIRSLNESIHENIFPVYALNLKNVSDRHFYNNFELREDFFSNNLVKLKNDKSDIEKYLINNGADCYKEKCFFYFIQDVTAIATNIDGSRDYSYYINLYFDEISLTDFSVKRGEINGCSQIDKNKKYKCFIGDKDYLLDINEKTFLPRHRIRYMPVNRFHRTKWNSNINTLIVFKKIQNFIN